MFFVSYKLDSELVAHKLALVTNTNTNLRFGDVFS